MNPTKIIGLLIGILLALIVGIAIGLIPATIFYFAWKEVAVPIFNAPALTFFQCWLVTAVLSICFNILPKSK